MTTLALGIAPGLTASFAWGLSNLLAAIVGQRTGSMWTVALRRVVSTASFVAVGAALGVPIDLIDPRMPPAYAIGILAAATFLAYFTSLRLTGSSWPRSV